MGSMVPNYSLTCLNSEMCVNSMNSDCVLVSIQCSLAVTRVRTIDTLHINSASPTDEVQKEGNLGNINYLWHSTTFLLFPPCVPVIGQRT